MSTHVFSASSHFLSLKLADKSSSETNHELFNRIYKTILVSFYKLNYFRMKLCNFYLKFLKGIFFSVVEIHKCAFQRYFVVRIKKYFENITTLFLAKDMTYKHIEIKEIMAIRLDHPRNCSCWPGCVIVKNWISTVNSNFKHFFFSFFFLIIMPLCSIFDSLYSTYQIILVLA